jgi:adenosylmethionine-8-amino-7-oxononanoate aminotransferase
VLVRVLGAGIAGSPPLIVADDGIAVLADGLAQALDRLAPLAGAG